MTYDELLARIDNVTYAHDNGHTIDKDRIVKQLNGLRAVVELHKPINYRTPLKTRTGCDVCTDNYKYPCSTIQAIEKELA